MAEARQAVGFRIGKFRSNQQFVTYSCNKITTTQIQISRQN